MAGQKDEAESGGSHILMYGITIIFEWMLFGFIFWKSNAKLQSFWNSLLRQAGRLPLDIGLALSLWLVWTQLERLIIALLGPENWGSTAALLPNGKLEMTVWIGLSITAGICEETIFRGYLQQQLLKLTGHLLPAIIGQAILFGVSHGYQGWKNMALITALGILTASS